MFPFVKKTVSALFISALLTSAPVFADIVISGTRIIYDANKKDVSVRLENKGNRPLLVQNWLDTGNDNADPSQIKVPFASTPPRFAYRAKTRANDKNCLYQRNAIAWRSRKCVLV